MSLPMDIVAGFLTCIVLVLNAFFYVLEKVFNKPAEICPDKSVVVITGCDSGDKLVAV